MSFRPGLVIVTLAVAVAFPACARSPVDPTGDTTITTPVPAAPANGAVVADDAQPVILTVVNALVTRADADVSYTFEVATDSAFTSVVQTRKDVPQGDGQTTATLEALTAGRDYYWRARATAGSTVGTFSPPFRFTLDADVPEDAGATGVQP
jgi:hypothetical protein